MISIEILIYGAIFAILSALNAYFWGLVKNSTSVTSFNFSTFLALIKNIYFILAIFTAFLASFIAYFIIKKLGIIAGRFFQVIGLLATIMVGVFIFKESLTPVQWLGVCLILLGIILVGSS